MSLAGSLEGVTVVAFEHAVAAPLATRHLADLGARVVKVERPEGDGDFARHYDRTVRGESSWFVWLNRGKESVCLDLKLPADLDLARRLVKRADVVLQNLLPGAMARLGLDLARLRIERPELVTCSLSGYGPGGPDGGRKAYDLLMQAEAGVLDVTGTADHRAKAGISVSDIATGMYAFSGVLAALYRRAITGLGDHVEVSMLDCTAEWMMQPYYWAAYGGSPLPRSGSRHASIAPYGPFRVGDGSDVFLAVQSDREWTALCVEVLGRPELATDPRFVHNSERVAQGDVLTSLVVEAFSAKTYDEVHARLDAAGIASSRLRTPEQLQEHPQLVARGRWTQVDTPTGRVRALRPALLPDDGGHLAPVPALGQHTDAVRAELATT